MPSFEKLYHETEYKIKEAIERFNKLKSKCEVLSEENAALKEENSSLRTQLEETEEKLKLIELTNTIVTKEDRKLLKRQIDEWVREIDSSIKILESE